MDYEYYAQKENMYIVTLTAFLLSYTYNGVAVHYIIRTNSESWFTFHLYSNDAHCCVNKKIDGFFKGIIKQSRIKKDRDWMAFKTCLLKI